MLIVLVFLWLLLSPFQAIAQEETPAPTATPSATLAPPVATETPVPVPSATPTTAPATSTSTPTPKSVIKKTNTSQQQGGLGGPGLVDEKDEVDTGLGFDKDNVQGAATSRDVDSTGDKDLLSTLIFLTGAVVLVVWSVYMILVQKGIIKSDMKKSPPKGGITPQPLQ